MMPWWDTVSCAAVITLLSSQYLCISTQIKLFGLKTGDTVYGSVRHSKEAKKLPLLKVKPSMVKRPKEVRRQGCLII
jgi:transcription termination factor Rho